MFQVTGCICYIRTQINKAAVWSAGKRLEIEVLIQRLSFECGEARLWIHRNRDWVRVARQETRIPGIMSGHIV